MKVCSVEGCGGEHLARTWCSKHYQRWKKYGNVLVEVRGKATGYEDSMRLYAMRTSGDCVLWMGPTNEKGYGRAKFDGNPDRYVHRVVWEKAYGKVPVGYEIDHKCRQKNCISLICLRLATRAENMENHGGAKTNNRLGYRGVYMSQGKIFANTYKNKVRYQLGPFPTPDHANEAIIAKRLELNTFNEVDKQHATAK